MLLLLSYDPTITDPRALHIGQIVAPERRACGRVPPKKKKKRVPGEGDFPLFSMRSPGTIIYISGEGKYTKT